MIELILSIISYVVQIACTALAAGIIFAVPITVLSLAKVKLNRRSKISLTQKSAPLGSEIFKAESRLGARQRLADGLSPFKSR